jgi:hypothetical protein
MRRYLFLSGAVLVAAGIFIFLYASERNCIIALLTSGRLTFWTVIEVIGGIITLIGFFIATFSVVRKA